MLRNRNVTVGGHRTSMRLEPDMWGALEEICVQEEVTVHEICTMLDERRPQGASLTALMRVFILRYFRIAAEQGSDGNLLERSLDAPLLGRD